MNYNVLDFFLREYHNGGAKLHFLKNSDRNVSNEYRYKAVYSHDSWRSAASQSRSMPSDSGATPLQS